MRRPAAFVLSAALLCGVIVAAGGVLGAFKATTANSNNNFTAAADWVAPTAARATVGKSEGGVTGYARQGGTFWVYAQVTDSGGPASGTASVVASEPNYGAVPLSAGSFTAGGLSWNWRNPTLQTLPTPIAEGTYTWNLDSTDNAGNTRNQPFSVVIDNTVPSPTAIATANGGPTVARPEQNDTVTFSWNDPVDGNTILAGWLGAAQNVVVRVNNAAPNDQLLVYNAANTTQLPIGVVDLGGTGYVTTNRTFGATGTASVMTQTGNSISIVLGTQSGAGTTQGTNTTMNWTPSATVTDRAGNPSTTGVLTEAGAADREF